jgi:nitric oxide synthase-interacting protein
VDDGTLKLKDEERDAMCPSCKKGLSNSVRIYGTSLNLQKLRIYPDSVLSVMKGCSHVTCKTCTDTLVRPGNQCVVCDKLLAKGDILELKREG